MTVRKNGRATELQPFALLRPDTVDLLLVALQRVSPARGSPPERSGRRKRFETHHEPAPRLLSQEVGGQL